VFLAKIEIPCIWVFQRAVSVVILESSVSYSGKYLLVRVIDVTLLNDDVQSCKFLSLAAFLFNLQQLISMA